MGNSVHKDGAPVDDCVQKDVVLEDDGVHEDAAPKDDGVSEDAALKDAVVRTMTPRPWSTAYATEYDGLDDTGRPVFDRPMLCLSFGRYDVTRTMPVGRYSIGRYCVMYCKFVVDVPRTMAVGRYLIGRCSVPFGRYDVPRTMPVGRYSIGR